MPRNLLSKSPQLIAAAIVVWFGVMLLVPLSDPIRTATPKFILFNVLLILGACLGLVGFVGLTADAVWKLRQIIKQGLQPAKTSTRASIYKWILITSPFLGLLLMAASFAIPASMDDGVSHFSGVKKEIAQEAIDFSSSIHGPIETALKFRVESVTARPPSGQCWIGSYSNNPDSPNHYEVVVTERTIFGLAQARYTLHGCQQLGM